MRQLQVPKYRGDSEARYHLKALAAIVDIGIVTYADKKTKARSRSKTLQKEEGEGGADDLDVALGAKKRSIREEEEARSSDRTITITAQLSIAGNYKSPYLQDWLAVPDSSHKQELSQSQKQEQLEGEYHDNIHDIILNFKI